MNYSDITKKIDDYARAHYGELKQEETSLNRKLNKYDIAQLMLTKGVLKEIKQHSIIFMVWILTLKFLRRTLFINKWLKGIANLMFRTFHIQK